MRVSTRVRAVAIMATAALLAIALVPPVSGASSHREAPMISQDPAADGTDFYMFKSPDRTDTVTLIANYYPFQEPAGGPNFYRFGDDVLYRISIDDNGDTVPDQWFDFQFTTTVRNGNTFLYNTGPVASLGDPNLNIFQTYTVTRTYSNGKGTQICTGTVPPNNIGPKSTPNYPALAQSAVASCSDGIKAFAGQRDDPFYVDLGATFDLLTIRPGAPGNKGGGKDDLSGYNVLSIALQVPINKLTNDASAPTDPSSQFAVIGGWTTSYRQKVKVLNGDGTANANGPWVQVSRLGAPLVNEVVIPVGMKDLFNGSQPKDDAQFANYVTNPELGTLLKALYNVQVPPQGQFGSATQRDDLIAIFLTGIKGLNQPPNVKPAEELRLNVAVAPSANPNRMGVLGGDNQGFPTGRRLGDDVTDIALQAVAGGPPFTPAQNKSPNNQRGDGVNANDVPFLASFPYVGTPTQCFDHTYPGHRLEPVTP